MKLYELTEEINDVETDIIYYENERTRLATKLSPKATQFDKIPVQGGVHDQERVLLEFAELGQLLEDAKKKLANLTKARDKKYNNYKQANNYDKQIYIEKKLFKWKDSKISAKHNGISRSQIFRICKKIEKE